MIIKEKLITKGYIWDIARKPPIYDIHRHSSLLASMGRGLRFIISLLVHGPSALLKRNRRNEKTSSVKRENKTQQTREGVGGGREREKTSHDHRERRVDPTKPRAGGEAAQVKTSPRAVPSVKEHLLQSLRGQRTRCRC
ncbi:hypothetical protein NPIL_469701 [Nephila pilipes]|uniref:Uncharacterized protein n=1 Tax=Nephila pilipes TaxID=299642 RepID=A0A8X6NGH8_NEPPI|nr:hypothetical protein NPIL_469701 [Nephila pilipes]